ncbi:MAG: hypothetical protein VX501_01005 [Pseudomonadota bacterium]|jgi:hypothetical protein|nr:hypothetical protein [Pseudomonadota bacterium]
MPYERVFVPGAKRFETRFFGRVPADEIVQNYMEMIQSDDWSPDVVRLITVERGADLSDLTYEVFENRFIKLLEDTAHIAGPPNKNAWIIESEVTMPIVQTWELMPAAQKLDVFGVFATRDEALDWLHP